MWRTRFERRKENVHCLLYQIGYLYPSSSRGDLRMARKKKKDSNAPKHEEHNKIEEYVLRKECLDFFDFFLEQYCHKAWRNSDCSAYRRWG